MTVSTTTNKKQYTANGTQDTFAYDFLVLDKTHLKVYVDSVLRSEGSSADYTVTGIGNPSGGNVVFNAGKLPANGAIVTLLRDVPMTQTADYVPNDKFSAETHEGALDKLTMLVQQVKEVQSRAVRLAINSLYSSLSLPDPVADYVLAWKTDLSGLKNIQNIPSGEVTITPFIETLLDDTDIYTARKTLGMDISGFSASSSSDQTSIASGVDTKVVFDSEIFDIADEFDHVTSYRFSPTVNGYYQFNASVQINNLGDGKYFSLWFAKNGGSTELCGQKIMSSAADSEILANISGLIYMNGTTDYIEVYGKHNHGSELAFEGVSPRAYFSGILLYQVEP